MPTDAQDLLIALLDRAVASKYGLVLKTNDPLRARTAIYQARKAAGVAEHQELTLRASPLPDGNLLIVKTEVPAPAAEDSGVPAPDLSKLGL